VTKGEADFGTCTCVSCAGSTGAGTLFEPRPSEGLGEPGLAARE